MARLRRLFRRKRGKGKEEEASAMILPRRLSPEKEEEMINWLVEQVNKFGMEPPVTLFLESIKPLSAVGSQLAIFSGAPLFLEFLGIKGHDWALLFGKRENVERILKKIEEGAI